MIQLERISKGYGGQNLFDSLDWFIPQGQCIGLVGPNGAGKTTLFRILAGEEQADGGRVLTHGSRRIGYLAQEIDVHSDKTVLQEVIEGRPHVLEMEHQMEQLREAMAEATGDALIAASTRYGELEQQFAIHDGYALRANAERILGGMGFGHDAMHRRLDTYSGGWQMRAMLSKLLLAAPDLLLLDEPTNHLDLPTIEWLEGYLREYAGTIIIISHDRYFLNRMVTHIAELRLGALNLWTGNYDEYEVQKDEREELQAKAAAHQQKEIDKIEAFVRRFRSKATKAKQVQSRVKALDKIDRIAAPSDPGKQIQFSFPQPSRSGRDVLMLSGARKAYGDNVVYDGVDFQVTRGERVALVGPNGAGKTTLFKMLAGQTRLDGGELLLGHNVTIGYFAQHAVDALDLTRTVLQEMQSAASDAAMARVRTILGAFLFSGDAVDKRVSVLSGGEKNRLALARMLLEPANLLLLDEPTNHLDMQSCEVLEAALDQFEGTICFISHDRHFINTIASRVVHVEQGRLENYLGDYEYYHYKREQERLALEGASPQEEGRGQGTRKELKRQKAELRQQKTRELGGLKKQLERVETDIADQEGEREKIEQRMADPALYSDGERVRKLTIRNAELQQSLERLYEDWERVAAAVEFIESRFAELEDELTTG